uniref:Kazal-like domain-containing protein n=1 Tax=Glossina pallidipes TaxID=7398 RepID=A0A1B0AI21_GLOPL
MFLEKLKYLLIIVTLSVNIANTVNVNVDNDEEKDSPATKLDNVHAHLDKNSTNMRGGRLIHLTRNPGFAMRRRMPIKIIPRADHYPVGGNLSPVRRYPLRFVQGVGGSGPLLRYSYESPKSSKYINNKGQFLNNGKVSAYRHQLISLHPNSLATNPSQQYLQNFKASAQINSKAAVLGHGLHGQQETFAKLIKSQQGAQNQHYIEPQQHPIPDQEKMLKYNEQHEKYLQQQQHLTARDPLGYYKQQQQQQQAQQYFGQTQQNAQTTPPTPSTHTYSVYEDNDMTELQNVNYLATNQIDLEKEAQDYLRFMNTNDYFVPRREPNYKQLDEENDKRQYQQVKKQNQEQHQQQQQQQQQQQLRQQIQHSYGQKKQVYHSLHQQQSQKQQQQHQQQQQQLQTQQSAFVKPIKISNLYYQDDATGPIQASTVVRTSYSTGYKQSQIKQTAATTVATPHTPAPPKNVHKQIRYSSRTPEPMRFEFTEQDAIINGATYTHAPKQQLKYKAVLKAVSPRSPAIESSTSATTLKTHRYNEIAGEHNHNDSDDPEDDDDMQGEHLNVYGRQPLVGITSSTTERAQNDQKDTEEYCERICAIVDDEHEEIVCGSDGYMYTSEAQMECYASCLHIDVTILSKGSCTTR